MLEHHKPATSPGKRPMLATVVFSYFLYSSLQNRSDGQVPSSDDRECYVLTLIRTRRMPDSPMFTTTVS